MPQAPPPPQAGEQKLAADFGGPLLLLLPADGSLLGHNYLNTTISYSWEFSDVGFVLKPSLMVSDQKLTDLDIRAFDVLSFKSALHNNSFLFGS